VNAALSIINLQFILHFIFKKYELTSLKVGMFQSLRKHLLEELEQAFPEDVEQYREIRASSAAEAKRLAQSQSTLPNGDVKVKAEH